MLIFDEDAKKITFVAKRYAPMSLMYEHNVKKEIFILKSLEVTMKTLIFAT